MDYFFTTFSRNKDHGRLNSKGPPLPKIVTEADDGLLRTFLPKQRKLMLEANEGSISKEESEERILFFMLLLAVILASMSSIFTIKEEQSL